jgi:replicative DNA helicase
MADSKPKRSPANDDVARIKLQPQSVEAEQSVIGGLMISADAWDAVAELVSAEDFYRPDHRLIFRQISRVRFTRERRQWSRRS